MAAHLKRRWCWRCASCSTWQADTGRLMSNNTIGRRRHSPPTLGCTSPKWCPLTVQRTGYLS
ncbi:hypothetical protein T03_17489 [Trichinella britovi]|uniref:Uncharacterized protein n=1 Tax=Trichinella britovi TaxID=45882 RepID=A0A0V1C7C8_TRIBR|nr:hypothetical protein T03_17489 [Trichinella britovi]